MNVLLINATADCRGLFEVFMLSGCSVPSLSSGVMAWGQNSPSANFNLSENFLLTRLHDSCRLSNDSK